MKINEYFWSILAFSCLGIFIYIKNTYNRNKIFENSRITVVEYLGRTPAVPGEYRYHFKRKKYEFKVYEDSIVRIKIPESNTDYKFYGKAKIGDKFLFIHEKGDPDNYTVTHYKVDYPLGSVLDTLFSVEELDSLGYLGPIVY